jgi:hypothetical protein
VFVFGGGGVLDICRVGGSGVGVHAWAGLGWAGRSTAGAGVGAWIRENVVQKQLLCWWGKGGGYG